MSWHHNDLATLAGTSLSPSSHTKFSSLFAIMELMIFTYSITNGDYDVTDDESENVDIFLNL